MDEKDMTKFFKLIDKVKKIDNNAALYLLDMVNDYKLSKKVDLINSDNIGDAFVWSQTPQGLLYWENICNKLSFIEVYWENICNNLSFIEENNEKI